MSRGPDNGLRKLFHGKLPQVHWTAIELGVVGRGAPDTNGCFDGVDFWIEFKATESHAVGLRPEQVGWILRRMRAGGRVFVITRREHDGGPLLGPPVDQLWCHEGSDAAVMKASGLMAAPPVFMLEGGPSNWDWGHILETLVCWPMSRR